MPALLISAEEYPSTSFEDGDCEHVDGVPEKKDSGEVDHSDVQGLIYAGFLTRRKQLGLRPPAGVRTRVSATRHRVPDIGSGINYVRVIDPQTGRGHISAAERRIAVVDGKYRTDDPAIEMDCAELFAD